MSEKALKAEMQRLGVMVTDQQREIARLQAELRAVTEQRDALKQLNNQGGS